MGEPLNVEILQEWNRYGVEYRYLRYTVGTFKGKPARMAAILGWPAGAKKVPGLVQVHGGGQMAHVNVVQAAAQHGYVCVSINWLGNRVGGIKPGLPNTDWGAVDATQTGHNTHFFKIEPDAKTIDDVPSPRNSNWYLGVMAARRALTLLAQQPQVDRERLGIYGHSMGGTVSSHVAAVDKRVKAAVITCGGVGQMRLHKFDALSQATTIDEPHLPLITCALLIDNPTNDFNGTMDDADAAADRVPSREIRFTRPVHLNHRTTPEHAACWLLWFDCHLKDAFRFPHTPRAVLILKQTDGIAQFEVTPDPARKIVAVDLYYSRGGDPRVRFWIKATATLQGDTWVAKCPVLDLQTPLRSFANVTYALDKPIRGAEYYYEMYSADRFSISSRMLTATPAELRAAGVQATDRPSLLIDDFDNGLQDWWTVKPSSFQLATHKIADPKWRGPDDCELVIEVQTAEPNELLVMLEENALGHRGGRALHHLAKAKLNGGARETLRLKLADFKTQETGEPLKSWAQIDELNLRPSRAWRGTMPEWKAIRWERSKQPAP